MRLLLYFWGLFLFTFCLVPFFLDHNYRVEPLFLVVNHLFLSNMDAFALRISVFSRGFEVVAHALIVYDVISII